MNVRAQKLTVAHWCFALLAAFVLPLAQAQGGAVLLVPANGALVSPGSVQFSWTAVPGVLSYTLWVGTAPGTQNVLYYTTAHLADPAAVTSTTANLPAGATLYATMTTKTASASVKTTSTFQTTATSYLVSPANGATVYPQNVQFSWTAVAGALSYTLSVGSTPGASDALSFSTASTANPSGTTSTTANLNAGQSYYVTVQTQTASGSTSSTSSFQTFPASYLTSPASGAAVSPQNVQFNWTAVPGVLSYTLWVGTAPGTQNVLYYTTAHLANPAAVTSTAANLPAGATLYATLTTKTASASLKTTSTFQTTATSYLISPANGATISPQNVQFSWTAVAGALSYSLSVGSTPGASDALSFSTASTSNPSGTTGTTANLNPGRSYYVTVRTQTASGSTSSTSSFQTFPASYLISPASGAVVSPQNVQFNWTAVPGTLGYTLWVGTAPGSQNVFSYTTALLANPAAVTSTAANLPAGVTLYATLTTKTASASLKTASTFQTTAMSYLISPANGAMIYPQNVQFSWTAVAGALSYTLSVGSTPGASDALSFSTASTSNPSGTTSTTANLNPGQPYYVTIQTQTASGSTSSTSSFQTFPASYLISPASGATVFPQNAQFNWTTAPGVLSYTLWIGTAPGAQDVLYYTTAHLANPAAVTSTTANLPAGVTLYATMTTKTASYSLETTLTFQTTATSYLISPANGASVSPQNTQFSWTAVPGALSYTLSVGSTPGASDALLFSTASTSNPSGTTSTTANLNAGQSYYATVQTHSATRTASSTSSFQTTQASYLTSPVNGAMVSPQSVPFSWTATPGTIYYTLCVGSTPGAKDALYYTTARAANPGSVLSAVATLPPGATYYVTLWTLTASGNQSTATSFKTSPIAAVISPANGASNLDAALPISISWFPVQGAGSYELTLGSSIGAADYFDSGPITSSSITFNPNPNTTYYARLWTINTGSRVSTDSVFSTGYGLAHLTYPLNGEAGVGQFQPFTWSVPAGATSFGLLVSPTGYTNKDFYIATGRVQAPNASEYVWALQPNTTYYVQLCTSNPGPNGGGCVYSSFTTGSALPAPSNASAFYQTIQYLTGQVRQMTIGTSNVPASGTYLYQFIANRGMNPTLSTTCGYFAASLLDQFAMNNILARQREVSLNGAVNHVTTEYWDPYNLKWEIADPTFGIVYFDTASAMGQSVEDLSALLAGGEYSAIKPVFVTPNGSQYATSFYMDPVTLYNQPIPFGVLDGTAQLNYLPNSPLPFLNAVGLSVMGTAGHYEFQFPNSADSLTFANNSSSITITGQNSQGWSYAQSLNSGWEITSSIPDGMNVYQFKRVLF